MLMFFYVYILFNQQVKRRYHIRITNLRRGDGRRAPSARDEQTSTESWLIFLQKLREREFSAKIAMVLLNAL